MVTTMTAPGPITSCQAARSGTPMSSGIEQGQVHDPGHPAAQCGQAGLLVLVAPEGRPETGGELAHQAPEVLGPQRPTARADDTAHVPPLPDRRTASQVERSEPCRRGPARR